MNNFTFKFLTVKQVTTYGILGSIATYAFGSWSQLLSLLCVFIGIDLFTGVAASLREGKGLNSSIGFWGFFKKFLLMLIIFMAHRMDVTFGTNYLQTGATYFYLANEALSVVENYGRLGYPLPPIVVNFITVLKDNHKFVDGTGKADEQKNEQGHK